MSIVHLTEKNFEQEVLASDKPVLVDYWASWCGPCKMLSPIIEELSNEYTDAKICKVNVDDEMELASRFGIMNIPTLIVFKDGKISNKAVGVLAKEDIIKLIQE